MNGLDAPGEALLALRRKYRALISLRVGRRLGAPRQALRSLAHEFPGVLRELDRRPMSDLEQRLSALEAAIAGTGPCPPWVLPQHLFHGFLRAALRLRPRLRGQSAPFASVLWSYVPGCGEPTAVQLTEYWLTRIRRPPGGRLSPLAQAFVAEALGLAAAEVEALLAPGSSGEPR